MKRISTTTKVVDKFGAGKHGFTNGNVVGGMPSTDLEDSWYDNVQEEIANVIEAASITLDGSVRTQLLQAIRSLSQQGGAPGQIAFVAQTAPPAGWVKANGALLSRTTYATLFAAIGTTYGSGDGWSTFAVPDLRGEFLRALDDGRGVDSGRNLGSFQKATVVGGYDDNADGVNISYLSNKGAVDYGADPLIASLYPNAGGWYSSGTTVYAAVFGSGFFAATRPRNIALLACIKY